MNKLFLTFLALFIGIFIGYLSPMAFGYFPSLAEQFGIRTNGFAWFRYGPAIISSCKCVTIVVSLDGVQRREIQDPKKILAIEAWIQTTRLQERYDYSPQIPYIPASSQIHAFPFVQLFASTDTLRGDSFIMELPVTPSTLGVSQNICDGKLVELNQILEAK